LIEITSRQQQTQRKLFDLLRVECEIEKPSKKLLAVANLDSDTRVAEVHPGQETAADRFPRITPGGARWLAYPGRLSEAQLQAALRISSWPGNPNAAPVLIWK